MSNEVKLLRDKLHQEIDLYGLEYEKVIQIDRKLHEAIIREMKEVQNV